MSGAGTRRDGPWWRGGVIYQIYPRSFADTNGDGVGDLPGIIAHLDYLQWLGVDAIWLNPVTPSPNDDWGYDVADYCDVHPELGELADLDTLVLEANAGRIEVVLDLVPNHTSDRHPWFLDSRSSRDSRRRDWYVWADGKRDGSPPNNWLSVFGVGPAWHLDERTGQYYLHNFLPSQPDLNWWNEEVRQAFGEISRFWFDRGIAGFRIDVAHGIVKDRELRDNPPADSDGHTRERHAQRQVYNMNRPEVHDVLRRWRKLADSYDPPRVLIGETWVMDLAGWAAYYGSGQDELHLAFNFAFALAPLDVGLRAIVEETEDVIPEAGWPVWTLSNHDIGRFPTRMCAEDDAKTRCALMALLMLRGTPVLYYGDEIGMRDVPVSGGDVRDPAGRDACRTPMQWSADPGAGFTAPEADPWLPLGKRERNVAGQRDDGESVLTLCRDLIALRRELPVLSLGRYTSLSAPEGVWAWRRGDEAVVALNLSDGDAAVGGVNGTICVGTRRDRDGERVSGDLRLGPWDGVVVAVGGS